VLHAHFHICLLKWVIIDLARFSRQA
jgi:hypothetical protein